MNRKKSPDQVSDQEPAVLDPAADPGAGAQTASPEELGEALQAARAEAADYQERYLRAKAETENIRRRAEADISNVRKFALEGFASEILHVRDNLERAQAVDLHGDGVVEKVVEGLALTLKQMDSVFERFGLTPIEPVGERFDPERHQAMTMAESSELPPGHVLQVAQKGYLLNGRLLRPAMVVVSKEKG